MNKYLEKIASPRFIKEILKKNPGVSMEAKNSLITDGYKKINNHLSNPKLASRADKAINTKAKAEDFKTPDRRITVRESLANMSGTMFRRA